MIKVDVLKKKGLISFVCETRDTSQDGLADLDEFYAAIMGSMPKDGGYMDSNRFKIEVLTDIGDNG